MIHDAHYADIGRHLRWVKRQAGLFAAHDEDPLTHPGAHRINRHHGAALILT